MATSLNVVETNGAATAPTATVLPSSGGAVVFASVDAPSTTANLVTNTINPGARSFSKFLSLVVPAGQTAPTSFDSCSVAFSAVAPTDEAGADTIHVTAGLASAYASPSSAASPVATNPTVGQTFSLTPPTNAAGAASNYLVLQLAADSTAAVGDMVFPTAFLTVTYSYH